MRTRLVVVPLLLQVLILLPPSLIAQTPPGANPALFDKKFDIVFDRSSRVVSIASVGESGPQIGSERNVVVALYKNATWYAGRTDYRFETEDGQTSIMIGVSNLDDVPGPDVPDDLLAPDSDGRLPDENPALLDKKFEIVFDRSSRVVSIASVGGPGRQIRSERNVVTALYKDATGYAGRTDYSFETEDGQTSITVGVSNQDDVPGPDVPDDLQEPDSLDEGPPDPKVVGQTMFNLFVQTYGGEAYDSVLYEDIGRIVERLEYATAHPDLAITFKVVRNEAINAFAMPGGYVAVFKGLIDWAKDVAPQSETHWENYTAAVLAHELAHVTLGHGGDLVDDMQRQVGGSWAAVVAGDCLKHECELTYDASVIAESRFSREREFAADAAGGLYLLRAGWEIQDAMETQRQFDRIERDRGSYYAPYAATYARTHPRSSEREAALEELRGSLKRDQARFDDALTLIRNNIELERAAALLDGVLDHFPTLLAARHARGVAYHRMFLNRVPIQAQHVRVSMPTYEAYFLPSVRAAIDSSTMELAKRARLDYQAVLEFDYLPYTISNLATLECYFGDWGLAIWGAQFADSIKPNDPQILNNLGAVQFYSGLDSASKQTFVGALALAGRQDSIPILFNLGKTLYLLEDPSAEQTLRAYLELDRSSQWRWEACEMLGYSCQPPVADTSGLGATVAGVRLGGDLNSAIAVLGEPERTTEIEGAEWLHYDQLGISVLAVPEKGITFIQLGRPEAGSIEGLRVGDPFANVYAKLGVPVHVDQSWQIFKVGGYNVLVALESFDGTPRIKAIAMGYY